LRGVSPRDGEAVALPHVPWQVAEKFDLTGLAASSPRHKTNAVKVRLAA
jgi:hypothetical protein